MPAPSNIFLKQSDLLKQKLNEFIKENEKDEDYVVEYEVKTHYCVFSKRYLRTVAGVIAGTSVEIFKAVHAKYRLKNKDYIAGDVLCGDLVVQDGVCFNLLKEPISKWTKEHHYGYLFGKDLVLTRTSDFYEGYLQKQTETEAVDNAKGAVPGDAANAAKITDLEKQLQSKNEEIGVMKSYVSELEKWIESVRTATSRLPHRLYQKLHSDKNP
jgi:hypothetical protein